MDKLKFEEINVWIHHSSSWRRIFYIFIIFNHGTYFLPAWFFCNVYITCSVFGHSSRPNESTKWPGSCPACFLNEFGDIKMWAEECLVFVSLWILHAACTKSHDIPTKTGNVCNTSQTFPVLFCPQNENTFSVKSILVAIPCRVKYKKITFMDEHRGKGEKFLLNVPKTQEKFYLCDL